MKPDLKISSLLRLAAVLVAFPVAATKAGADPLIKHPGATHEAQDSITPMLGVSARYGLEAGVKVDYLIADKAFVPSINDAVFLEGSVFVAEGHAFVAPLLRWDFNVHPQWTVYGEGGLEIGSGGDAEVSLAAGAIWRLPQKNYFIRGELDFTHISARIGPVFAL